MKKIICVIVLIFVSSYCYAGEYINSAHGTQNGTINGVDRISAYTDGNCIHCHELHTSPDKINQRQNTNFCFDCHVDTLSQRGARDLLNYSYSYRAGNYNDSANNDNIKQAFNLTSSHNLESIVKFITGKWGYTEDSNPCCACHNPHATQGDPADSTRAKNSSKRGYLISRPTFHTNRESWGLWGDISAEKMNNYSSYYQAPYRKGSTTAYEPDGSIIADGSNLTDFVTFCQDCHANDMIAFGLSNTPIDWTTTGGEGYGDKHGKNIATQDGKGDYVNLLAPYSNTWNATSGLVLACTDCHEPHGSTNLMLIREEVNGAAITSSTNSQNSIANTMDTYDWVNLCSRCHDISLGDISKSIHHDNLGAPYAGYDLCDSCHADGNPRPPINCYLCHYHGSDDSWVTTRGRKASGRGTF